ncbi:MAG: hypothetical protein ACXW1D_08875 [Halobacteriota archaeon]
MQRHENNAEADERSPREPDGYSGAAEQAEVKPGDEVGDGRAVDRDLRDALQACDRHKNTADENEGKAGEA